MILHLFLISCIDGLVLNCCFMHLLPGVLASFVLLGFFGLILHCSSFNSNDPRMAGCQNCCYGWGILDCFPASMEACFALVIVFVVIFAILGIAYGFLAATMAIQRIWQRHYHILTKRELTKVSCTQWLVFHELRSILIIWKLFWIMYHSENEEFL